MHEVLRLGEPELPLWGLSTELGLDEDLKK